MRDAAEQSFQDALNALNAGKLGEAEALFKSVLKSQPRHVGALNLLTIALMRMERFADAEGFIRTAVKVNQTSDVSFYNYGLILKKLNKPNDALKQFALALKLNPAVCETWNNRGTTFNDLQQFQDAISDFDKAIALKADYPDAYCNKGKSLTELARHDEALAAFDKALALKADLAEAWLGRGNVLFDLKRTGEALAAIDKALALKPDLAEAWLGRGNVLCELKRHDEAFAAYDKALARKPDLANAWNGRGNALFDLKRTDEALAAYDKALALDAGLATAWNGRGNVFFERRRPDEAFAAYDKAFAGKPDLPGVEGARLNAKMQLCDWKNLDAEGAHLVASIRDGKPNGAPFAFLSLPSSPADQLQCATLWAREQFPPAAAPVWQGEKYKHDRIRVAYLSADLREHPVAFLMAGLFESHDKTRFETTAISLGPDDQSGMRARLQASFDRFVDASADRDEAIAKLVRELEIDILVDLMGYTGGSRTGVFALRPAPLQVNYLGYAGTMGAPYVDYIMADTFVIPDDTTQFYTETVVRLPGTYMASDSKRKISQRVPTRAEQGLPETGLVFCCFNNSYKISPNIFDIWMRLLSRHDDSVLWLSDTNETAIQKLRREASKRDVEGSRLIFAQRVASNEDHLARHQLADLFLDTLAFNAHSTASDALWAGLPVLTCAGDTFAGRVAASLLHAIRLPELVAATLDDYERIAGDLAANPDQLAAIKRKLADNRLTTPCFDTEGFTKHIEAAYIAMVERTQAGLPPDRIVIPN